MPADISAVVAKAIPLCEPSATEETRVSSVAFEAKSLVDKQVTGDSDIVEVVFGGSFAKGTWLRGDADIDIFFKVKPSVQVEKFEEMGRSVGQRAFKTQKPRLRYSDHPYVEAFIKDVRINVVPCYDVEQGKWQSAADRSPFHTEFIKSNFDGEKKKHARLLKRFLKSVGTYGAEISIGGFSGYVSEVLVLKYGSFEGVLRGTAEWKNQQVVSISDNYDQDIVQGFSSPIIILDPVDDRRNLGTAISPQSVGRFMSAARTFLERPSTQFFYRKRQRRDTRKLLSNVVVVEFSHKQRSPDVVWGQLKRSTSAITKQLELSDFVVLRSSCCTDEKNSAAIAFLLESTLLPPYAKKKGPDVFRRNDTASFLSGKKKPLMTWIDKEMRIAMLVDRKVRNAQTFTKWLLQKMENSGVVKDLIASRFQIYNGDDRKVKGVAKEAVMEIVSTEHLIFG